MERCIQKASDVLMQQFPENIKFKFPWRKYQQRFLDRFQEYFKDGHLHVVAPPGSGKTVLGLEAMLRINQPTLIVAPTIALRNQWIQRFRELFLQSEAVPQWISDDLKNPKFLTVATYQGIHSVMTGFSGDENSTDFSKSSAFLNVLKTTGIKTLILDEAHHLKNAWWRSLMEIKRELEPDIVALTATPPLDVSGLEWQNYLELNGPVDVEISVPELMLEGDLCPHQDLVYFSVPTQEEQKKIDQIHQKAQTFFQEILEDSTILEAISSHPVYQNPEPFFNFIYDNISAYTSGLVFLHTKEIPFDKIHFEVIGDQHQYVPQFDFFWLEELLDFYLFTDDSHFRKYSEHRTDLENRLRRSGFLEYRKVVFYNTKILDKILNTSIGKLDSVLKIADSEFKTLGDQLRMVVLTDFIRKEFIVQEGENLLELNKIGSVPVFEKLRREKTADKKIGVLTGNLVILPKAVVSSLCESINSKQVYFSELSFDPDYCILNLNDFLRNIIVEKVTDLFQKGEILILIGTRSLLGEGWDAPKINTLILASFVSTFVQSNQMRGRAIRTDKDNYNKTSNIWHLVCFDETSELGGEDLQKMYRRFRTFVCISNSEDSCIENKFSRMNIENLSGARDVETENSRMLSWSEQRNSLKSRWETALKKGNSLIEEIEIPFAESGDFQQKKLVSLHKTIRNFSFTLISSFLMFWSDFLGGILRSLNLFHSFGSASAFILLFGIAGFFTYGGTFFRSLKQYLRYKNISKKMEKISIVVVQALHSERQIRTPLQDLKVVGTTDEKGNTVIHLEGGTHYEKSRFILTLQELLDRIDNPRYLLKTKGYWLLGNTSEYYAVPEIFGKNKKNAEHFAFLWNREVEKADLIFTRNLVGRKLLLKLRFQSLMKKNVHIEHIQKWIK